MPLKKYLKHPLLIAFIFAGCGAEKNMNIAGKLVYTDGGSNINSIIFDHDTYDFSPLYVGDMISTINNLTKVNSEEVLFDECVTGQCSIKLYSSDEKRVRVLRSGSLPNYIPNHDRLFFYDGSNGGNSWLFVASMANLSATTKIAEGPKSKTLPNGIRYPVRTPVIQVSDNEIVFAGKNSELRRYNFMSAESSVIGTKNCRPILWRSNRSQLLCSDWDTWDFFSLDIETGSRTDMPELKGAYGFVYIPNHDALIYGRARSSFIAGEAYDIFLYHFKDKNEILIRKNAHLAGGVWIESDG